MTVQWLLGSLLAVVIALYVWERWTNRASALPKTLETLATVRSENTVLKKNVEQAELDKDVLRKEASAQKKRADDAEARLHDLEARTLDLLHGSDLLDQFNRLREPLPDADGAPGAAGDGVPATAGVQRVPAVVDPWPEDRG